MKKLITILTLSLTLLISSSVLTSNNYSSIILHVNSSTFDTSSNLYISQAMTENEEIYSIQSYDNISNQWLDATITANGKITTYKIMP